MKALFVIDAQKDFIDGVLGTKEAQEAVKNIPAVIENGDWDYIFYTLDTHGDNYLETEEGKNLPVPHCIASTPGWMLNDEVAEAVKKLEQTGKIIRITKRTFGSDIMPEIVRQEMKTDKCSDLDFTFVGFCTDICVISNVMIMKAYFPEAKISVIENCCAGVTPESHQAALTVLKSCQTKII